MQKNFPNDDNGKALRNMEEAGDDLSKSRIINFSLLFYSRNEAQRFIKVAQKMQLEAVIEADSPKEAAVDVTVKKEMLPTHQNISDFESMLEGLANPFGGANDGWGCFSA